MLKKPFQKLRRALSRDRRESAANGPTKKSDTSSSSASGIDSKAGKPADGPISLVVPQAGSSEQVARVADAPTTVNEPVSIAVPPRGRSGQRVASTAQGTIPAKDPVSVTALPVTDPNQQVVSTTAAPAAGNVQRYVVFT